MNLNIMRLLNFAKTLKIYNIAQFIKLVQKVHLIGYRNSIRIKLFIEKKLCN